MTAIQIPYGASAHPLHFDFPDEWDPALVTAVSLTILDRDANELLSADNLTLYTDTTLLSAVDRFSSSIVLAADADDLAIGDMIKISGTEGAERGWVKGYDSDAETVELEGILENEYAAGDDVIGCFGNYTLDVSTVATFTAGLLMVFKWTPTGDGQPIKQEAQIATAALDITGLRLDFADAYPRAYSAFTKPVDKFDRMMRIAERRLGSRMAAGPNGFDIQRINDQSAVIDAVLAEMAVLWLINGDVDKEDERNAIYKERNERISVLQNSVIATDDNQDDIEDEEELTSHEPIFERSW